MTKTLLPVLALVASIVTIGCGGGGSSSNDSRPKPLVVNSADDVAVPPAGTVTLRSALARAKSGQKIVFDASLDGKTIALSIVGEEHTILRGEVMGIRDEPSGPVSYLVGYLPRDYGRSALFSSKKNVVIDASDLPNGITIAWTGGMADPARVLAVFGNLTMTNVKVAGGYSMTVDISATNPDQPWTLGRGGGLCVWGRARLTDCTLSDNHCVGDFESSRDRGAFGGGLYANWVELENCVIGGNTVLGGGAAGGGVYSVGGAGMNNPPDSVIRRSAISGNRISALFTYGAGVYSDGGGIGNSTTLTIEDTTIARNLVEPAPGMPPFLLAMGYWRGGAVYISNGSLSIHGCTIVQNETHGVPRTDSLSRQNLAGGIAATIGNAHAVEYLTLSRSIVAGNTVTELGFAGPVATYEHDIFTGTLFYFRSRGYNLIGVVDFSQMLVPVGQAGWASLCRRHFPKAGDRDGVVAADVLDLAGGVTTTTGVLSAGVNEGDPAVLHYRPQGAALDRVPITRWTVEETYADYSIPEKATNDFLAIVLARIEARYGLTGFAADFTADFEAYLRSVDLDDEADGLQPYYDTEDRPIYTLADTQWFGPQDTWPKEVPNHAYIEFWHRLDSWLVTAMPDMAPELLGDEAWDELFDAGRLDENDDIKLRMGNTVHSTAPGEVDQVGTVRPVHGMGDVGAVELK